MEGVVLEVVLKEWDFEAVVGVGVDFVAFVWEDFEIVILELFGSVVQDVEEVDY